MSIIPNNKLDEAISTMLEVANILTTTESLSNAIPDKKYKCGTTSKPKSINAWFIVKEASEYITIVFGNFELNNNKYTHVINLNSYSKKTMTNTEREALQAKINAKIEADKIKQESERKQKQLLYSAKYMQLPSCNNHPYAINKGLYNLHHYDLKQDNNLLCIPFYKNSELHGYQTIAPDSTKRFNGSVGGCYWQYPNINPNEQLFTNNNSFYLLGEGFATVVSAKQAIENYYESQLYMAYAVVAFNVGNLDKVIKATKHSELPYILLVDNDANKTKNTGVDTARQLIMGNADCRIYPLTFNAGNDANDYIMANGEHAFIDRLIKYTPVTQFIGAGK